MIWGVILAAGESKRMGRSKQLLPFGKTTLIETVIEHVLDSHVEKILVILGANSEKIEKKLINYPVLKVSNPRYREGMLSSVQAGFNAIPKEDGAVLVILGDQPTIPGRIINRIIDAYLKSGKGIVLPVYQARRGHPVLIDVRYHEEVASLDPDIGLRALIQRHPEDVEEVTIESPAILNDIDNPSDYQREFQSAEKGEK